MKQWWIEFEGYCAVEADNSEDAELKALENLQVPLEGPVYNEAFFVTKVIYIEPEAKQLSMFDEECGQ